jgi:predicted metal-dependent HD superfamily phosphohydrolase
MASEEMRTAWRGLLDDADADRAAGERVLADLVAAHAGPDRFYHNLEHVLRVLETVASLHERVRDFVAVRFAARFHDAVHDPRAGDNEERSAALAGQALGNLGVAGGMAAETQRLILLTKAHRADAGDADGGVLLDADLAILGTPDAQYREYAAAIRREYAWVPDEAYRTGRAKVLREFLRRERIYSTPEMFAALEERARENLAAEVRRLEEGIA